MKGSATFISVGLATWMAGFMTGPSGAADALVGTIFRISTGIVPSRDGSEIRANLAMTGSEPQSTRWASAATYEFGFLDFMSLGVGAQFGDTQEAKAVSLDYRYRSHILDNLNFKSTLEAAYQHRLEGGEGVGTRLVLARPIGSVVIAMNGMVETKPLKGLNTNESPYLVSGGVLALSPMWNALASASELFASQEGYQATSGFVISPSEGARFLVGIGYSNTNGTRAREVYLAGLFALGKSSSDIHRE